MMYVYESFLKKYKDTGLFIKAEPRNIKFHAYTLDEMKKHNCFYDAKDKCSFAFIKMGGCQSCRRPSLYQMFLLFDKSTNDIGYKWEYFKENYDIIMVDDK